MAVVRQGILKTVNERNNQLGLMTATNIRQQFDDIISDIELLATTLEIAHQSPQQQLRLMLGFRHQKPLTIRRIHLFDENNQQLIHLSPFIDTQTLLDNTDLALNPSPNSLTPDILATLEKTKQSSIYISPAAITDQIDQVPIVYISARVQDDSGQSKSNQKIAIEVELRSFWRSTDKVSIAQTGHAFIFSEDGVIIAHPDRKYIGTLISPDLQPALNNFRGHTVYIDPISGQSLLASFGPVGGHTNWGIVIAQEESEALTIITTIASTALLILIVSTGLATVVTILLTRSIAKPIDELSTITKAIAQTGDLSQQVDVDGPTEVQELGLVFNQMISELASSRQSLQNRIKQIQLLRKLDQRFIESGSFIQITEAIIQPLRELIDCDIVSVVYVNHQTGEIELTEENLLTTLKIALSPEDSTLLNDIQQLTGPFLSLKTTRLQTTPLEQHYFEKDIEQLQFTPLDVEMSNNSFLVIGWHRCNAINVRQQGIITDVARQLSITGTKLYFAEQSKQYSKTLEEEVSKRTEELAFANKNLESFTYSVSHDLRAPLRAITGFARILNEQYADELSEKPTHYLQRIQTNATKMGTLIDSLLNLARLGSRALKIKDVELKPLVEGIVGFYQTSNEYPNAQVSILDLPTVTADEAFLKIIYDNLIGNALKYSAKAEAPHIEIGQVPQDTYTVPILYVTDNGVGFDMQYVNKLFGVFQRLHHQRDFPGIGIGLATVQRIIHLHDGKVWAESKPDIKTTFYFTIGTVQEI